MRWLSALRLLVWASAMAAVYSAAAARALLHVVMAEHHGIMFCHACDDLLQEGSYIPALPSFYSPSGYYELAELVYGVPNRAERPLLNVEEVRGRIVLFDRGKVSFAHKVQKAQQAGALGVIIVDNATCDSQREQCFEHRPTYEASVNGESMLSRTVFDSDSYSAWQGIRIPSVLISAADGERLKSFMPLEPFELQGETHFSNEL